MLIIDKKLEIPGETTIPVWDFKFLEKDTGHCEYVKDGRTGSYHDGVHKNVRFSRTFVFIWLMTNIICQKTIIEVTICFYSVRLYHHLLAYPWF